jgi:ATP phosphoribosyltransferase regulatory subunit
MVQSNHYYTGIIFRGFVNGAGEAVLSGGRYDDLISDYGSAMPAVGFAIDVDLISSLLQS